MTIRPMKDDDIATLVTIEIECFTLPWTKEGFREECNNQRSRFFVACEGDLILGYIGAWKIFDEYEFANVAVRVAHRRRGVARALMEYLFALAKTEEVHTMTLEVRASNLPAINLYKQYNFRQKGTRPKYYMDGEDALILWHSEE